MNPKRGARQLGRSLITINTRSLKLLVAVAISLCCFSGCQKKQADDDAIRAAVKQHLVSLGTLNLQAMDMDFNKVTIQDNQATAAVSFRPKTGAPAGAAMQVAYRLERREGNWSVVKTAAAGGVIEHPAPGANPHAQSGQGSVHGSLPNFQDVLGQPKSGSEGSPPPGHPPAAPSSRPPE